MTQSEKSVIVTGGESGIGRGIVERFLESGARVCMAGIQKEEADTVIQSAKAGERLFFQQTDVRDEKAVNRMVLETVKRFGRLDTVIANAGLPNPRGQNPETLPLEKWNDIIAVNLTGVFLCAKHAFPELRKTRGSMVLIASTRAQQSEPNGIAYNASKGGVVALAHALAISGGPDIRVNSISPGWIYHGDPNDIRAEYHAVHPVGRVGRHADIAAMAAFLASEEAGFITAENFVVDGGMTKKMNYKP